MERWDCGLRHGNSPLFYNLRLAAAMRIGSS
jgi:hypothetical protein